MIISRREMLGVVGIAGTSVCDVLGATSAQNREQAVIDVTSVKALVFDVFGTVVDWRTSVAREVETLARRKNLRIDGAKFADAWRAQYGPSMNRVRKGELPWTKLDDLHRMVLDTLLPEFGITGLSETEMVDLNRAWHRLQPWPDAVRGLTRLKGRFVIAPLSNGNIALMTNMAKQYRDEVGPWRAYLPIMDR